MKEIKELHKGINFAQRNISYQKERKNSYYEFLKRRSFKRSL